VSMTTIELLRHGDTGQRGFRGRLDDALSELGWQQLRQVTAAGHWDVLVSSPLRRCAEFAAELAAARGLPLWLEPRLAEYDFGDWEGRSVEDIAREQPDALQRFWADPLAFPPPRAETLAAFAIRVEAAIQHIAGAHDGRRVLVISHGGVIRLLHCRQQQRPLTEMANVTVAHASLQRLSWPLPQALPA
jgi:alpha-ribazole phosphatase